MAACKVVQALVGSVWTDTPRPQGRHPPGRQPLGRQPPGRHPPGRPSPGRHPPPSPETVTASDGTHPTAGMHSCYEFEQII